MCEKLGAWNLGRVIFTTCKSQSARLSPKIRVPPRSNILWYPKASFHRSIIPKSKISSRGHEGNPKISLSESGVGELPSYLENEEESASKFIGLVGRIQFLLRVGLRFPSSLAVSWGLYPAVRGQLYHICKVPLAI